MRADEKVARASRRNVAFLMAVAAVFVQVAVSVAAILVGEGPAWVAAITGATAVALLAMLYFSIGGTTSKQGLTCDGAKEAPLPHVGDCAQLCTRVEETP